MQWLPTVAGVTGDIPALRPTPCPPHRASHRVTSHLIPRLPPLAGIQAAGQQDGGAYACD